MGATSCPGDACLSGCTRFTGTAAKLEGRGLGGGGRGLSLPHLVSTATFPAGSVQCVSYTSLDSAGAPPGSVLRTSSAWPSAGAGE